MLSRTQELLRNTEGRYATDAELQFLEDYAKGFPARLKAYQLLRKQERSLLQATYSQLRSRQPDLFPAGDKEALKKWQRDTIWVIRFSGLAMLLDDVDALRDRLMLWFQTIMRAFGTQKTCYHTYAALKETGLKLLGAEAGPLFVEVMESNRELFDLPEVV